MSGTKMPTRRRGPPTFGGPPKYPPEVFQYDGRIQSVTSESAATASIPSNASGDLTDEIIEFVSQNSTAGVPPRKKQKLNGGHTSDDGWLKLLDINKHSQLEHIVVNKCVWDIQCSSSKLSNLVTPVTRKATNPVVNFSRFPRKPMTITINNDTRTAILYAILPEDESAHKDVRVAMIVAHDSNKWAKEQGRLWTEFGVQLRHDNGHDTIRLLFAIKWNITASPYSAISAVKRTEAVREVLNRYFPDPNVHKSDVWSPQDFYQSAHTPEKDDSITDSLVVPELESELYPFQKRTVQWLLRREGYEWSTTSKQVVPHTTAESSLPLSFISVTDAMGQPCYVSHLLSLVALDLNPFRELERDTHGGILAEEMGLGKTVEMVSLITLNRRSKEERGQAFDVFTGTQVRQTAATLIIAPPAISQQWVSEINKHAPHLSVVYYEGIRASNELMTGPELEDHLASADVVVSTYNVLAVEIHFTQLNPEKSLRQKSKYPRPKSPLMTLQFFRVVMDEAQMIESGVSNAAVVARMVPRVNAWCVTGTPVRKDVTDLLGLLVFLRYEPIASTKHIWSSLTTSHKQEFRKLFSKIALRHSKMSVRDELKLPPQRRYVITMPFTAIEEQHYQGLFDQMCEELNLDNYGTPLDDEWKIEDYTEIMRRWLVRLRQTALHPEVGGRNRKALGHKDGPLRTVDQVLDVMIEQADFAVRTEQRILLVKKLRRGQLFENSPRVKEALEVWTEAAAEAHAIVEENRQLLREEVDRVSSNKKPADGAVKSNIIDETDNSSDDEMEGVDANSRLGILRTRLRSALEMEHVAMFFCANAYFQIKSNKDFTKPDSPDFERLEKLETEGYESAKRLRREILQDIHGKAERRMKKIAKRADSQTFVQIPEFPSNLPKGGLESRRIMEQLDALGVALDAQANQLDEWREETIQFLLRPLVDEDDGLEITGDEYEESTKTQDEVMVYVQALRAVIADRHDALTGQENKLVEYEVKTALRLAKEGGGAFPEKTTELLGIREQLKPPKSLGFVRRVVAELRALATSLRTDSQAGNSRAQNELSIVEKQLKTTQKQLSDQTKALAGLEKEIESFASVMNTRLEYYKQLQQVSDMVAPYEGPNNDKTLGKWLKEEEKLVTKIAQAKSKRRYLLHLKMEAANPQEQRICVICREGFEIGALTVCGHQYCKECIQLWWSAHRNCPVCKKKLIQADLHEITYKPQELSIQAEEVQSPSRSRAVSSKSKKSAIYSEISKTKLAEIKNIDLDGPSFTTKVDTLARHLIWLRESDPGAKSIIYSQFKDFLDVLALAFKRFRIGFSSIDKPRGIERFKEDPSVECFLLHARAHSSGLNLVNASHVFLCEPLLNTALELQAIARVDRIGQHQETNVWLYLVDGTVEESIHTLSVKRRMQHLPNHPQISSRKGKERESDEEVLVTELEEANSKELEMAGLNKLLAKGGKGGEMVEEKDLWECLFGGARGGRGGKTIVAGFDGEVDRFLRAEAAGMRRIEEREKGESSASGSS
ncbi:P-loop containing nucleoside triphosphate hydrolase [Glarea lozoyensis ATCC 20868]|uniref:p-loop containing nucleoside triphosphate hydrolase n=1 Tax=Glarea lozoyensis (strain ATCC 20868 / MF5171) TaxID=1116229 RepID=S3E3P5_GLAL2|nr:P-loop containing nucleoside triphosphate hydrolase [Glarea lozoyensis ATCC 20868]EPE33063.1 P-loop containing nucleoside triphosphate hydrolase [Glarea lozoyensis ATCC 20868]